MKEKIHAVLSQISAPHLQQSLQEAGIVADYGVKETDSNAAYIKLQFPYPAKSLFAGIVADIKKGLQEVGIVEAEVECTLDIKPHIVQGGVKRLPQIKNIIAVSSAKGGVGKSATAANLALALVAEGAQVGMLDADIYGPSLPVILGIQERPQGSAKGGIEPLVVHNMQVMSIGFLVDAAQPMVWRGPIATRALTQLLQETQWHNLDYLVLDMPPGTGDIQLTIAQKAPVTGAIIVTTPQDLALADAQKGLVMFNKVSVPTLGIVENMSVYCCPNCGHSAQIFGIGGAKKMCEKYDIPLLGEVPLDLSIRADTDAGCPTVLKSPDSAISAIYRQIAHAATAQIAKKPRDHSSAFPQVVVEK